MKNLTFKKIFFSYSLKQKTGKHDTDIFILATAVLSGAAFKAFELKRLVIQQ
ncbi:MAG: hypothetical protein WBA93_13300 [Microcoleaceae cyanobacterium]